MRGIKQSLNVAVAFGVVVYEFASRWMALQNMVR
jgi:tRNA G18 (ribose-2'-O)-methylase SpoU